MVKTYSDNLNSIKNAEDFSMKQMFDISEKLIPEQSDEIYGVTTINWGFTTLQLCIKVQKLLSRLSIQPEDFAWRIICM